MSRSSVLLRAGLAAALALGLSLAPRAEAADSDSLVVLLGSALGGDGLPLSATRLEIEHGRIVRLGTDTTVSATGPLLDARALVVVPGFIDLRSGAGLSARNEEGSESSASLHALDLVDTGQLDFPRALASGVTTVLVSPGGRSVIGGLAAALKTDDRALAERIVAKDAGLVVTLGAEPTWGNRLSRFQTPTGMYFRRPGTRMGVVSEIRRAFDAAARGEAGEQADVLRRALSGEIPVLWRAHVEQDIRTALRISGEIKLPRTLIVNPVEAHRVPELLTESQGAIVGPFYQVPRRLIEGIEGEDFRAATPHLLAAAGVPLAIGSGPDDPAGSLRDRAILAMRAGLSAPLALAAITGIPASLLGLSDVGDLSVGKAGDLVILDGPPLAPTSRVLAVVIEGRVAWTDPGAPAAILSLRSSQPPTVQRPEPAR